MSAAAALTLLAGLWATTASGGMARPPVASPALPSGVAAALAPASSFPLPRARSAPIGVGARDQAPAPRGFEVVSQVRYSADPERVHSLTCTYVLPDRARWLMQVPGEAGLRWISYRRGAEGHELLSGEAVSRRLEDGPLADLLRRVELRRALFQWPEGFAWGGEGAERRVELPGLGALVARIGEDGLPVSVRSLGMEGEELEEYRVARWRDVGGRRWPSAAEFCFRGERIWSEELVEVSGSVRYLDSYFLPVDRRDPGGKLRLPFGKVEHADLPPMAVRRVPLAERVSVEQAFAKATAAWRDERVQARAAGLELESRVHLELGPGGVPVASVQRLKAPPAELPEGWVRVEARPALTLMLAEAPADLEQVLRALLGVAPEGASPGTPYLTAPVRDSARGPLQLVVPLSPRDGGG